MQKKEKAANRLLFLFLPHHQRTLIIAQKQGTVNRPLVSMP